MILRVILCKVFDDVCNCFDLCYDDCVNMDTICTSIEYIYNDGMMVFDFQ